MRRVVNLSKIYVNLLLIFFSSIKNDFNSTDKRSISKVSSILNKRREGRVITYHNLVMGSCTVSHGIFLVEVHLILSLESLASTSSFTLTSKLFIVLTRFRI